MSHVAAVGLAPTPKNQDLVTPHKDNPRSGPPLTKKYSGIPTSLKLIIALTPETRAMPSAQTPKPQTQSVA